MLPQPEPDEPHERLRATFDRILNAPAPPSGIDDKDLTIEDLDRRITAGYEWLAIHALRAAYDTGLDDAGAETMAGEFIVRLRGRLERHAENVRREATP